MHTKSTEFNCSILVDRDLRLAIQIFWLSTHILRVYHINPLFFQCLTSHSLWPTCFPCNAPIKTLHYWCNEWPHFTWQAITKNFHQFVCDWQLTYFLFQIFLYVFSSLPITSYCKAWLGVLLLHLIISLVFPMISPCPSSSQLGLLLHSFYF